MTAAGGARADTTGDAAPARTSSGPWHGPASLVGVVAGVLLFGVPYVRSEWRGALWLWLVPPVLGLLLLAVRGPVRRVGVGLLASCVTLPLALLMIGLSGYLR